METFVQEDSPLANYLEGEGEAVSDWTPQTSELSPDEALDAGPQHFAPTGRPKLHNRIKNKLPAPLRLKHSNKRETLARIQDACVAVLSARIGKNDNDRFLEQFGYIVVASQLLNEPIPSTYNSIPGVVTSGAQDVEEPLTSQPVVFDLHGILFSAVGSFAVAWAFHWARPRQGAGWNVRRLFMCLFFLVVVAIGFVVLARRQWLKYIRCEALGVAKVLVGNAQNLDSVASASVLLIQEVELVSRGYRLSTPMPPVSRMEEQSQTKRCLKLRRILSECLSEMLTQYIAAKRKLQCYVDSISLVKYYDIYDFSPGELEEAELVLADICTEEKTSLKSLRILFSQLYSVRKSMLCCLLALPADGTKVDTTRWNVAVEEMQRLSNTSGTCIQRLTNILNEQDRDIVAPSPRLKLTPDTRERHRAQLRRLNSLSQGIRGVHAKMHLIRDESEACIEKLGEGSELSNTLLSQYESIGADLRGLLQEWEAGKSSLMANLERPDRLSRPPSILKSPASPTFSLSGSTAVDGSPAAALRRLNGEDPPPVMSCHDLEENEEIFEAVALPRKRSSMTREERIARVREDRAKQAAARERADANTHMLRELETVIKLRPQTRGGARVTSI
ncbi:hypothetical protein LOZ52_000731 [Ophidiomyces ophidiicola]|nr:hypothetical protein LOZ64_003086 [Ophidiomyces ophidiicola]KAI2000474.1 hypothetical protein LOZ50_005892 [Ophidiomyces ophidiicola]KAI2013980.1 hypothetical protein LOZ49_001620 [Ophidiomyces ophidiicola]KAI2027111.1 hypothetical protein LOZ46_000191 [Ophidiomyces ophidiicola]KAI2039909.1 hypothetical protein LOZ47_001858 [Ophidiomyces ophidiicola]